MELYILIGGAINLPLKIVRLPLMLLDVIPIACTSLRLQYRFLKQ